MGAIVRYNNLTGGLNTVQGINTINQSTKRTESPEMVNIEYYKLGGLCSMQGNRLFGTAFDTSITLGYEYVYGNDKYLIICTADGKVWRYNQLTNSYDNIYTFPTATQRHSICSFNNGIVMSNGVDDLVFYQYNRNQLLDGSVTLQNDNNVITGTSTSFTSQLGVGDYIRFDGINGTFKVESITNDTSLTLDKNIEYENDTDYYAFSDTENIYYTIQLDNGSNIIVYTIDSSNNITEFSNQGSISNNTLTIPISTTETVTKTRWSNWTQPVISSNESWGTLSNYAITTDNGLGFSSNTTITWSFPTGLKLSNIAFSGFALMGNYSITIKDSLTGTILGSSNVNVTTKTNFNIPINSFNSNGITIELKTYTSSFGALCTLSNFTLEGQIQETYQVEETTTSYFFGSRDEANDKLLSSKIEDVQYYLTELSELNAIYVNTDDENISYPIRGLALNSYQGRIFVGANDGTLYYSEVGLIHGWDLKYGAGAIPTFYDDNSDFTALGLFDKYLVICKRERSYLLDGTDSNDANWIINPYSDYTCDSQQSWLVANNSFLVYSRNAGGIYPLLQRTIYNPNYQGNELSVKIRDSFNNLSTSRYDYIFPVYNPKKKYIMFYMPFVSGNGSNYCYIFDLQTKTWLLRVVPQNVTIAFRFDNEIYIGTQDGLILKEFSGTTFNGEAIEFSWKSPWFSFGDGSNYLSTREFRINLSEDGANIFKIKTRRDGIDTSKTRSINQDSNNYIGLEWESSEGEKSLTDTLWDEDSWTATKHTVKRFPLPNQFFQTIQVELCGNTTNEAMNIYGFEFHGIQLEEVPY